MTWRSLLISQPARLSVKHRQIVIEQQQRITVALEDVAVIVLESAEVVLTQPFLSALAEYGVTLLTCDHSHLPNGQWLSLLPHSRQTKIVRHQLTLTEPQKKRLWQKIVISKINNQAAHLQALLLTSPASRLYHLASRVTSGDRENLESQAAMDYFPAFLGKHFTRHRQSTVNMLLNYGYSILRGAIARSLVSYGFLPVFGLHHNNEQNSFNLADDLIEPWRPWVDLAISQWFKADIFPTGQSAKQDEPNCRTLTGEDKQKLISLLHHQARINQETTSVLTAINRITASFQSAILTKQPQQLLLPDLCPLVWHQYE